VRIIGFVGIQPRPLVLGGRRLRAAVATKLMTASTGDEPLAAVRLLSRAFAGPQDVLLSDLSNDAGRRIWEGLGGITALLYSFQWQRPVRPVRHSLSWLRVPEVPQLITGALRPPGTVTERFLSVLANVRLRPRRYAMHSSATRGGGERSCGRVASSRGCSGKCPCGTAISGRRVRGCSRTPSSRRCSTPFGAVRRS